MRWPVVLRVGTGRFGPLWRETRSRLLASSSSITFASSSARSRPVYLRARAGERVCARAQASVCARAQASVCARERVRMHVRPRVRARVVRTGTGQSTRTRARSPAPARPPVRECVRR
jgi:hypothetical protein